MLRTTFAPWIAGNALFGYAHFPPVVFCVGQLGGDLPLESGSAGSQGHHTSVWCAFDVVMTSVSHQYQENFDWAVAFGRLWF